MKKISTLNNYNELDVTDSGYKFTLYSDGHIAATYYTNWKPARVKQRFVTKPNFFDMSFGSNYAKERFQWYVNHIKGNNLEPHFQPLIWKQTRRGLIVY